MTTFSVNDVVQFSNAKENPKPLYRILYMDESKNMVALIKIVKDKKLKVPETRSYSDFLELEKAGVVLKSKFHLPVWMGFTEEQIDALPLGKEYKRIRKKNYEIIKSLVEDNVPGIFDESIRGALIRQLARKANRSEKDYYRLLNRYWKYGMFPNAMLPSYLNCGEKGRIKPPGDVKRGRPNNSIVAEHSNQVGINITKGYRDLIQLGIDTFYKNNQQRPLAWGYQKTLEAFFNDGMKEENGVLVPIILPANQIPTYGQFRYWYLREQDEIAVIRARRSQHHWNLKDRDLHGTARDGVQGPGYRFEIDSTIGDIYLVSRFNRNWIIGRPVIYLVVDVWSRMIVGFHVGLSGPSWAGARLALVNAFSDKVEFCKGYGVKIEAEDWPCHHLPLKVMADRGEFIGHTTEGMINGLGIQVENAPPYRPDWKAVVERYFRILNDTIKWTPGAVRARQKERGERDYRLDATLTLEEFTIVLIHSILKHNLYTALPDLSDDMTHLDINPYPVDLWTWGLENLTGGLKNYDREQVFAHLLSQGKATVTASGLVFNKMTYKSKTGIRENWGARARKNGTWKIDIRHDTTSTDYIYILPKAAGEYERCELRDADNKLYANKRFEEVVDLLAYRKLQSRDRIDEKRQGICEHDAAAEAVIQEASAAKAARPSTASKAERTSNISVHRNLDSRVEDALAARINAGGLEVLKGGKGKETKPTGPNRDDDFMDFIEQQSEKEGES